MGNMVDKVKLFMFAKDGVEKLAIKQGVDIKKYYHPNCSYSQNANFFEELCCDLQDGGYISGVIGYFKEYEREDNDNSILVKDKIEKIFQGFDSSKALLYEDWTKLMNRFYEELHNRIKEENKIENGNSETKPFTMWQRYVKGIYDGAEYLNGSERFNDTKSIEEFINAEPKSFEDVKELLYQLRSLCSNISCMGKPFCYNWIKECGALWLAKPDVHINRVVDAIITKDYGSWDTFIELNEGYNKYNDKFRKPKVSNEERVALFMWEWANEIKAQKIDVTTFQLDRILYLYCTGGNFYKEEKEISEQKLLDEIIVI